MGFTNALTAVNPYFPHARTSQDRGFARLGKITYDETVPECLAADLEGDGRQVRGSRRDPEGSLLTMTNSFEARPSTSS